MDSLGLLYGFASKVIVARSEQNQTLYEEKVAGEIHAGPQQWTVASNLVSASQAFMGACWGSLQADQRGFSGMFTDNCTIS